MKAYRCTEDNFLKDVAAHTVTVINDQADGHRRHIRCRKPNTLAMSFDILTWDDWLLINGDMGSWLFRRTTDMFTFFRMDASDFMHNANGLSINPGYWAEKLEAVDHSRPDSSETEYSEEKFKATVGECFNEAMKDGDWSKRQKRLIWEELKQEVLCAEHEFDAHQRAYNFECEGFRLQDFWEHSLREYKYRYIWCLYAIVWTIAQYDTMKGAENGQ